MARIIVYVGGGNIQDVISDNPDYLARTISCREHLPSQAVHKND